MAKLALYAVDFLLKQLAKKFPKIDKVRHRLYDYLYWNGLIRFIAEAYMPATLSALLNLKHLNLSGDFNAVTSSNVISIVVTVVIIIAAPIFFVIFMARKLKSSSTKDEKFPKKFESLVEGLNLKMKEKQ